MEDELARRMLFFSFSPARRPHKKDGELTAALPISILGIVVTYAPISHDRFPALCTDGRAQLCEIHLARCFFFSFLLQFDKFAKRGSSLLGRESK